MSLSSGTSYTVNAIGNMTARGSDTLAYDQANRLTQTTVGSVTTSYDQDGRRPRTSTATPGTSRAPPPFSQPTLVEAQVPTLVEAQVHGG